MSQSNPRAKLDAAGQAVAEALFVTGDRVFHESYTVTMAGNETGETIIVHVLKVPARRSTHVSESYKSIDPIATLPAGTRCTCCGGTGTVRD